MLLHRQSGLFPRTSAAGSCMTCWGRLSLLRTLLWCTMAAMVMTVVADPARGQSVARVDYPYACPEECQCQTTLRNGVVVECALLSIGLWSDFRAIQSNFTQGLIIQCDARHLDSKLLEGAFTHLTDLETLSLVDCAFTKVPRDAFLGLHRLKSLTVSTRTAANQLELEEGSLRRLSNLESLDLQRSNLQRLPEGELCALTKLKTLSLQGNALASIAHLGTSAGCLGNLEKAFFDGNSLRNMDKNIGDYLGPNLKVLSLSRNKLDSFSDDSFSRLKQLTDLDLSVNHIESISDGLWQHQANLERLSLFGNQVKSLPVNAFVMLAHLRELNLSQNVLTNQWITGDLFRSLQMLQWLDVSANQLTHIDRAMLRNLLNLVKFHAGQNRIEWIEPQAFTYQHKLELLDLAQNLLPSLEDEALDGLFALTALNLSTNQLKGLTENTLADSKKLTVLDVCNNQIQQLNPAALLSVRSLQILRLCKNQLTSLQPSLLRHLSDLQTLDISENRLKALEPETLTNKPNLRLLILSNNDLTELRETVSDKPLLRLEELQLDGNLLQSVGNWTAGRFTNLLRLNVSNNQITQLSLADLPRSLLHLDGHANSILQLASSSAGGSGLEGLQLRQLDLSNNQLSALAPKDLPASLQTLNLADNRIGTIERYTFYNKPRLSAVNLMRNRLQSLDDYALRISPVEPGDQLPQFSVGQNPFLCDCQMVYLKKVNSNNFLRWYPLLADLEQLECRDQRTKSTRRLLEVPEEAFLCPYTEQCFSTCHCCDFGACDCKMTCPDNCTCYHDQKWDKNIIDCSTQQLTSIPMMLPMDATDVYLDGNVLPSMPEHALIGRTRMQALYLNNSQIQRIDNHTFNGLSHLKVLHLHHNQITVLRGHEFDQLVNLEVLDLSWNDIHSIHPATFSQLTKLRVLNIAGNQLDSLVALPLPPSLTTIQLFLANNLWECWCNDDREALLTDWLVRHSGKILDIHHLHCYDRSQYPALLRDMKKPRERCSSSTANSDTPLTGHTSRVPVSAESNDSFMIMVGVILGCVCFVVILAVALILRYRYEIQVRFYSRFRMRLCSSMSQDEDEECEYGYEKMFDAFISYSDQDEHLVLGELAPRLEYGVPKYKLFLHSRDYPLGTRTPDSVIQGVQMSKRTILFLSENYLKREWSKLDFKTAHQQVFKDKRNKIIIVLLGDIQMKDLDVDLRIYLKQNPCLHWGEKLFWKKLYYALPDPEPVLENHYSHTLSSNTLRNGHIYSYPITDL